MKYFTVIFFSLLLTNFFGATAISNTILLGLLLPFVIIEFTKVSLFKWYFFALFIGLLLSIISCYYYREQELLLTFKETSIYYYIFFYFMLKYIDLSASKLEEILFVLATFFCISYIIQFFAYPKVIFSGAEMEYDFNDIRIRLVGQGFSSLGYFFGLNKFLNDKKKVNYFLLAILCLSVIFLMGFRTMFAMIVIFTLLMIIRVKGFNLNFFWYGAIIFGIFIGSLQIPVFANKLNNLLERNVEQQLFTNNDYIRVVQFQYFTQDHFKSSWEYIFGSGSPSENTMYGNYMLDLNEKGIWYLDLGLLGLSWIIGLLAVSAMIAYSVKVFRLKVFPEYYYLGIWFLYLVFSSFTTMEFYRHGNFIVQAIALFIAEKAYIQKNKTQL